MSNAPEGRSAATEEKARIDALERLLAIAGPTNPKAAAIIEAAVADGSSPGAAALKLIEADFDGGQLEAGWRAKYRADAALQREFMSEDAYVALQRWQARQA